MSCQTMWLARKSQEFLRSLDPSRAPGKVKVYTEEERRRLQAEMAKKG